MTLKLLDNQPGEVIDKDIYGQFAEHLGAGIYGGIYVGSESDIPNINGMRIDVVNALKKLHIPVLRWPGGLFADTYHWQDGVGPVNDRKKIVNTNWGDVTENNHFGTHEYFELLKQLDSDAYINTNMGSGTVREMSEWIEYITKSGTSPMVNQRELNGRRKPWHLKYVGIGNETWGGGGNMRPEYYADLYRQYQTFVPQYDLNEPIYKIACGPNEDDYNWTDKVMSIAGEFLDGLSLHYYTIPTGKWARKGAATSFPENEWYSTIDRALHMDYLLSKHSEIMDHYDPEHRVGLIVDEWGTWCDVEKGTNPGFLFQQNTIRDAIVAAITLNVFHKHADRVKMANIAQMVNVLQAMIITNNNQMVKTPTYYVFDLYQQHMGAENVQYNGILPERVSCTASKKDSRLTISFVNYELSAARSLSLEFEGNIVNIVDAKIIVATSMDAHNTFENLNKVCEKKFSDCKLDGNKLLVNLPAMSVVTVSLNKN